MSIRVMTMIWDTCLYQGGTLNVLLAMADHGSDNGRDIYPGMEYLAAKCRQSVRTTQENVKRLRADGVVILLDRQGRDLEHTENPTGGRGCRTEYRIDLERVQKLQGLHQEDEPDCEHCAAADKTPQKPAQKGAASDKKGAVSRSHIDNHQESSRTSLSPAGAGERGNVASLGKGSPELWPAFRKAVADTWPGGFPAENEIACRGIFETLTRTHPVETIIACALLHGKAKTAENGRRGKAAGSVTMHKPSNWLKDGHWQGYIPQAEAAASEEAAIVTALGNVRRTLGDGLFELLKQRGMTDAGLASLDGVELTGKAHFEVRNSAQRLQLERHAGPIERLLGDRFSYSVVPKAVAS